LKKAEEEIKKNNILLKGILENTYMMAVYLDAKFNFLFVNKAYADTCKHPQDFFPGKNHFDLYPGKEVEAIFQNVVDTGKPFYIEARPFEFPDQPERGITYWDWSLIPIKDSKKKIIGLVFTLAEVTEKINAGRELRESEKKLKLSMKSAGEGMWEWDFTTDQAYFDDVCLQMLGYNPGEIQKKSEWWWTQWHPDDVAPTKKAIKDYLEGRAKKYFVEFRLRNKSGKYVWIFSNGIVLRKDKNNKPLYMIGIHQDITERKKAEEELKKHLELMKLASELSGALISVSLSQIDDEINSAMKKIAQAGGANRSSLFLFSDDLTTITNTHEWCAIPADSQIKSLQGIPFKMFGYHEKQLRNHETVAISSIDDYPPEAKGEIEWVKKHGFRSLLFIPLLQKGKLYGALGFYGEIGKEIAWSDSFVEFLRVVGDVFASSLERRRTEEKVLKSREELRKLTSHLQTVREEERTTISRELHEDLGQNLAILKINMHMLGKDVPKDQKPILDGLESMMKLTDHMADSVGELMEELRPPLLDELGLIGAIKWY